MSSLTGKFDSPLGASKGLAEFLDSVVESTDTEQDAIAVKAQVIEIYLEDNFRVLEKLIYNLKLDGIINLS